MHSQACANIDRVFLQAWNRIHRIGQHAPITGKITVCHLVPYGSVDAAIAQVHGDKQALINLIQEGDDSGFGGDTDNQWRKGCRIVDACLPLDASGSFGEMPRCKLDPNTKEPIAGTTYTVLPGVVTRGREPTAVEAAADQVTEASRVQTNQLNEMLKVAGYEPHLGTKDRVDAFNASVTALHAAGCSL